MKRNYLFLWLIVIGIIIILFAVFLPDLVKGDNPYYRSFSFQINRKTAIIEDCLTDYTQNKLPNGEYPVKITLTQIELRVAPTIKNGRILVPFRDLCEIGGAKNEGGKITWNPITRTAEALFQKNTSQEFKIVISPTSYQLKIVSKLNLSKIQMDVLPEIVDGRLFVPIRFMAQSLGVREIIYIFETGSVILSWPSGI